MSRPVIALERNALAQLLRVPARRLGHVLIPREFDLTHTDTYSVSIAIPAGAHLLLTNIEIEAYPQDLDGVYYQNQRGAPADNVYFQWLLNGQTLTPPTEYHFYRGNVFLAFGSGNLRLEITYTALGGQPTNQRVFLTLHGYTVRAGDGADGEGATGEQLGLTLADMAQGSSAPDSAGV